MGPYERGGGLTGAALLTQHLEATREAVIAWLNFQDITTGAAHARDDFDQMAAAHAIENPTEPPPIPEAMTTLHRMEAFGLKLRKGEYLDQPHIGLLELEAVLGAQSSVLERKIANQKLKDDFDKGK